MHTLCLCVHVCGCTCKDHRASRLTCQPYFYPTLDTSVAKHTRPQAQRVAMDGHVCVRTENKSSPNETCPRERPGGHKGCVTLRPPCRMKLQDPCLKVTKNFRTATAECATKPRLFSARDLSDCRGHMPMKPAMPGTA
jgi:hypothetical protein